jgi:predicted nucleic acid-binding protein
MYVFDATPLIYLATVGRLDLVENLPASCVVPTEVYDEVVTRGLEEDHADARRIERAIEDGILETVSVPESDTFDRLRGNERLSTADAAVLAFADATDGPAVVDEQYGRDVADTEGIATRGTAYLVLWLLREGCITAMEATETVDAMLDAGWYCSPDLYASIRRTIDELD